MYLVGINFIRSKVTQAVDEKIAVLHGPSGPYETSQFEHSSIPATVKKIFNLKEFLTKRDAWAGTFEVVLTRTSPRTDCPGKPSQLALTTNSFIIETVSFLSYYYACILQLLWGNL